jgi:hypothetical protein
MRGTVVPTTNMNGRRRVVSLLLGSLVMTGAMFVAIAAGRAQADDPPPPEPIVGETPLDPITEALGADTPEEIADLQTAQQEMTAIGATDSPEGEHVNEVRSDLGEAVDDLYEGVAADPQAERARGWWRQCMAARDTPFDSPNDIEAAIDSPRDDLNQLEGHDLDTVFRNRDDCEDQASKLLTDLLAGRFPDWANENEDTIDEYRALIDAMSE